MSRRREAGAFDALDLLIPDMNGILRGKRLARNETAGLFGRGINLPASACLVDSRGRTIPGLGYGAEDGDPDFVCRPVDGSLSPVPWLDSNTGQCLLSMYELDGTPHVVDSRHALARVVDILRQAGQHPRVAVELEFYLLADESLPPRPRAGRIPGTTGEQVGPQVYSIEDLHDLDAFFTDVSEACELQTLPASTAISEYAPGQFEVNLHHVDDPVTAADHAILLRRLLRGVARRYGMAATFMAKPFTEHAGSSMHVHVSLQDQTGHNLFSMRGGPSDALRHAAGGLLSIAAEAMPINCPNANSYRRLQAGSFAPRAPNWGVNHRSLAVRIPLADDENTRIENRLAGADANPYLVVASTLAGMHHGLTRRVEPPPMVREGEKVDETIRLPSRWESALDELAGAKVLPQYLGTDFVRLYEGARRFEAEAWNREVSNLDYAWYLRTI